MDYLKKQRFQIGVIIFLVLINLITLGSFWYGKIEDPGKRDYRKMKFNRFEKELKLSPEQIVQIRELRDNHQNEMVPVVDDIKIVKKDLFRLMQNPEIDSTMHAQYLKRLADLHMRIEEMQFQHFWKTRQICNAEQKVVFDSMMQRMSANMYLGSGKNRRKYKRK